MFLFSDVLDTFRDTLAAVPAFQTFCGVASATLASGRVHYLGSAAEGAVWPLAVLKLDSAEARRRAAGAGAYAFDHSRVVRLHLEWKSVGATPTQAEIRAFVQNAGAVVAGLLDLAATSGKANINAYRLADGGFVHDTDNKELLAAMFLFEVNT